MSLSQKPENTQTKHSCASPSSGRKKAKAKREQFHVYFKPSVINDWRKHDTKRTPITISLTIKYRL